MRPRPGQVFTVPRGDVLKLVEIGDILARFNPADVAGFEWWLGPCAHGNHHERGAPSARRRQTSNQRGT